MPDDELQELENAIRGLTYPSESDAPFDILRWTGQGPAKQLVAAHADPAQRIDEIAVPDFFAQLADSPDAQRFEQLRHVLESRFSHLVIFRVGSGEVTVHIYLIAQSSPTNWTALHTTSIET